MTVLNNKWFYFLAGTVICISVLFYYHVGAENVGFSSDIDDNCKRILTCNGKVITCCSDDKQSCDIPQCSCKTDSDCYGQQVCGNNGICSCPGNGHPSSIDPNICCGKNYDKGYSWASGEYNVLNITACGCPGKGEQSQTNPNVCCYRGYGYREDNNRPNGYVRPHEDCPCEQDGFPDPRIAFSSYWQKTFFCSNHKWVRERSFVCGDEENPFSCRSNQGFACEPWGNCLCFNEMFTYPDCGK